ncbi:SecY-interacting protein [Pseudoalteromonas sp. MMG010]|uniref:SecY-interacting protein n=1 Tax=Pseudoalteromonas sp. MMG010 TaxID=2822685 RepID=UPI001B3A1CA4|nr:SecY-interacting protein [Pseudoalteromonas sp. MMG010]MBQ4831657.1 SecY-interacting protein [Pseudoalteromonas sp. MMG010]
MSVKLQLEQLHRDYSQKVQQNTGQLPVILHDAQWPSDCEIAPVDSQGYIQWQAVTQNPTGTLDNLANALSLSFPKTLSEFYGSVYGGNIFASIEGHDIELLQTWNSDDFELLQQNITGHILMKQKLKQPETVFIGLTEQEDLLVSVLVHTGEVCLEFVGKKTHHVLAPDMNSFLSQLKL